MSSYQQTWDKVVALKNAGQSEQRGGANILTEDDIQTICATIDFFGGDYRQDYFDLSVNARPIAPRYRVFDWLGMRVMNGRDELSTKVLVHSFIKSGGIPTKFIQDLRETDYDIDTSWENIKL